MFEQLPSDISVRAETPDDAAFLERLFTSLHTGEMAALGLPPEMIAALARQQYANHREQLRGQFPDADRWIIVQAGSDVGRVCVNRGADEHHLVEIVLVPETRGRGIGGAMLRAIQDDARAARRDLTLRVQHGNPALQLYVRLGFVVEWDDGPSAFMRWSPDVGE